MPKKTPKPKFRHADAVEEGIARRVREHRRLAGFSQADLAAKIGLTRDQLASVESGRTRLRLGTALKIAAVLKISLVWMAEDFGPPLHYLPPSTEQRKEMSEKRPFLAEYERVLRADLRGRLAKVLPEPSIFKPLTRNDRLDIQLGLMGKSLQEILPSLPKRVEALLHSCPLALQKELFWQVNDVLRDFVSKRSRELQQFALTQTPGADLVIPQKSELTNPTTSETMGADMKPLWPDRKRKIQKVVSKPGAKSALANFLGVELAQLSKWLTDSKSAREPGAEYALRMLYWVEHPELQK